MTDIVTSKDADQATLQMWHPNYPNIRSLSPASSIRVASRAPKGGASHQLSKSDIARKKKLEKIDALKQLYMNKNDTQQGNFPNYLRSLYKL